MKQIFIFLFTAMALTTYGQDKYNYVHFNKLTEVVGTEYVIASIENRGKAFLTKSRYLLFINTKNGQTKQIDFPNDGYTDNVEQIKIDSLVSKEKQGLILQLQEEKDFIPSSSYIKSKVGEALDWDEIRFVLTNLGLFKSVEE